MGPGEREGRDKLRGAPTYTAMCETARWRGAAANRGSAQRSATASTGGMRQGRRLSGKGTRAHVQLIHTVQQNLTQHRKAIYPPTKNEF